MLNVLLPLFRPIYTADGGVRVALQVFGARLLTLFIALCAYLCAIALVWYSSPRDFNDPLEWLFGAFRFIAVVLIPVTLFVLLPRYGLRTDIDNNTVDSQSSDVTPFLAHSLSMIGGMFAVWSTLARVGRAEVTIEKSRGPTRHPIIEDVLRHIESVNSDKPIVVIRKADVPIWNAVIGVLTRSIIRDINALITTRSDPNAEWNKRLLIPYEVPCEVWIQSDPMEVSSRLIMLVGDVYPMFMRLSSRNPDKGRKERIRFFRVRQRTRKALTILKLFRDHVTSQNEALILAMSRSDYYLLRSLLVSFDALSDRPPP